MPSVVLPPSRMLYLYVYAFIYLLFSLKARILNKLQKNFHKWKGSGLDIRSSQLDLAFVELQI